jgi:hypothetical protein
VLDVQARVMRCSKRSIRPWCARSWAGERAKIRSGEVALPLPRPLSRVTNAAQARAASSRALRQHPEPRNARAPAPRGLASGCTPTRAFFA